MIFVNMALAGNLHKLHYMGGSEFMATFMFFFLLRNQNIALCRAFVIFSLFLDNQSRFVAAVNESLLLSGLN